MVNDISYKIYNQQVENFLIDLKNPSALISFLAWFAGGILGYLVFFISALQ